jgi:signal transduction histidine kinase
MGGSLVSLQWRWNNPHPTTEGVNLPIERSDIWLKLARHHHAVPVDALEDTPLSPGDLIDVFGYVQRSETGPTISHGFVRSAESEGSRALPDNDRPLIDVQALHVLSKSALPNYFRIRGVVTCSRSLGGHHYLAIQDHTGGIFVLLPNIRARDLLTPGTLVDAYLDPIVAGRTNDLLVAKIIPRGPAAMPPPVPHPVEMVGPDRGAGQWIGVEGIVYATTNQNQGILRSAGSYLTVDAAGMTREDWSNLIDRRVRVQGVAAYPNPPRMTVLVPGPGYVEPTTFDVGAASSPSRRISEVSATKEIEDPSHRVRVVGTVTFVHERLAVIDDGSAAVSAQISEGSAFAKPGERVEAAGFPVSDGNGSTKLLFATLRADGRGAIPAPIRAAPSAVLDGAYGPRLVTFDAEIVGSAVAGTGTAFDLQSDGRKFRAWCPATIRSAASLPSGSQVRLVGFAYPGLPDAVADEVPFGGREQSVFVIRSASDLTYLHGPPWMALRRALFVIGTLAGVLVIAVFWVQILRRRVRQQKDQLNATLADLRRETELAATLTERQRLAGEIHDSLEQGISGIMLQLEGALKSPSCSTEVREILKGARNMVSFSHAEIRHAIWDLHSPTLDGGNLSSALQQIAARLGVDRPRVEVAVTGAPLTISPETDHHLLRIAQEAVTNSLKHADASKIVISLEYTPEAITLRIEDDGRGFDADGLLVDDGHFGLRSLQRRADKMNAELTVKSVPGDGTCVEVIIPSRNHAMI